MNANNISLIAAIMFCTSISLIFIKFVIWILSQISMGVLVFIGLVGLIVLIYNWLKYGNILGVTYED